MFVLLGNSVAGSCETDLQNVEIHLPSTNRKLCVQKLQSTKLLSRLMVKIIVVKMDFVNRGRLSVSRLQTGLPCLHVQFLLHVLSLVILLSPFLTLVPVLPSTTMFFKCFTFCLSLWFSSNFATWLLNTRTLSRHFATAGCSLVWGVDLDICGCC